MTPPQSEPEFRLASIAQPRKRRTGLIAAIGGGAALLLLVAGGVGYVLAGRDSADPVPDSVAVESRGPETTKAPDATPSRAGTPATARPARADEFGHQACERLEAAIATADLDELQNIGSMAALSADHGLVISGMLVMDSVADAVRAKGTPQEEEIRDGMLRQADGLRRACRTAGYL